MYRSVGDGGYTIPVVPLDRFAPEWRQRIVDDPFREPSGTIVVDTSKRRLYLTRDDGRAIRYGVGIGRAGFEWSDRAKIHYKRK